MPRKPVWQEDIKIVFGGVRVLPSQNSDRTEHFKNKQHNAFSNNQAD